MKFVGFWTTKKPYLWTFHSVYQTWERDSKRTLFVLSLTDWDVAKHFAFALGSFTGDLLVLDRIKVVLFVAVTAKALTCWPNRLAVRSCFHVAPICVETIFARFPNLFLIGFKFGFAHHFSAIVMPNDILILNVGLNVLLRVTCHMNILHFY